MRFGVCTGPENVGELARAGFDYIEIGVAPHLAPERSEADVMPALQAALGRSRLRPETFNLLLPGDWKVVGPGADAARQERYLATAFARAQAVGGAVVVFGSGGARRIPPGWPAAEAWGQIVSFLKLAGVSAARTGMQIAVEPLNTSECNFITSVAQAVGLAQAVAHPAVGVLSDLYHVMREGQSYDETRRAAPWLRHIHVAGAESRRAPVAADREFLRDYFAPLKAAGYTGRISIEGQWDDLPAQAGASLAVLRRAWEEA